MVWTLIAGQARAQVGPDGIDWVTIGAPGNAAYVSPNPLDLVNGRGRVDYEYKIGRFEVTTAQWVEFFNAAYDRAPGDTIPHLIPPGFWGGISTTPTHTENPNARRWTTTASSGMLPTGNISWRMAAIYCNWLCNDKGSARSAFLNGAYDVSTFTYVGNIFQDQFVHSPDARYWIPTWDEWLKAAHFDPQKLNADGTRGGWWRYSNGSDTPYVYGPPGVLVNGVLAQANAGWDDRNFPGHSPFNVLLSAYAITSPWGAYDMAGGTAEWTESIFTLSGGDRYRIFDGSFWGSDPTQAALADQARNAGAEFPHIPTFEFGFRIATVPSPGPWAVGVGALSILGLRRKRGVSWAAWHRGLPGLCHRSRRLGDDFDAPELLVMLLSCL